MFCTWADWDTLMPYHGPQLEMVWVAYLNWAKITGKSRTQMPTGAGWMETYWGDSSTCQFICQETVWSSRCACLNRKILIALDGQPVANTSTQIPLIPGSLFGCAWHCANRMITCSHEMRIKYEHLDSVNHYSEFCSKLKESQNVPTG